MLNLASCNCVKDIAKSFSSRYREPTGEDQIYQTSLMSALIDGVYDGNITIQQLLKHGDFGLGTFNGLDGEMVILGNAVHQLKSDGTAHLATMDQKTPFAVVTFFHPTMTGNLEQPLDKSQIQALIDEMVPENLLCAFRIDGHFAKVETRTVPRQEPPYVPMLEAIENQPEFTFENTRGTLIGFRCPPYVQGINVAGFHVHYITDDRCGGGHVLDYRVLEGSVNIAKVPNLHISLPETPDFENATLHSDLLDDAIRKAEG
jgi:acetolactate decarboxylase